MTDISTSHFRDLYSVQHTIEKVRTTMRKTLFLIPFLFARPNTWLARLRCVSKYKSARGLDKCDARAALW